MQYAYEDRIAELRARVDRTASRQLLDQEQFDQKLDQIMRRQTALESRATALGAIPGCIGDRLDPPVRPRRSRRRAVLGTPKPSPISDTVIFVAPPDREARLESRARSPSRRSRTSSPRFRGSTTSWCGYRPRSIRSSGARWRRWVRSKTAWNSRVRRMRGVINDLGLDMAQLEAANPRAAVGGPFVPVKLGADAGAFERQLYRINATRAQMERLNRTLALVPYRKPVIGDVEFTSGFGVRSDPFLGRPAMHYRARFPRRHRRSRPRHR